MQTRRRKQTEAESSDTHKEKKSVEEKEPPAKRPRGRPKKTVTTTPPKKQEKGKGKEKSKAKDATDGKKDEAVEKQDNKKRKGGDKDEIVDITESQLHHETHTHAKAAAERTVEKGHVYFFYRPKVEHTDATSFDEVQKLYLVLRPDNEPGEPDRLIVLTKKRLPKVASRERLWGFVDKVSASMDDIAKRLGPTTYETVTLGTRHLHGAKPCGSGVYNIVHHEGHAAHQEHTHFAYVLELPETPGELQKDFNIAHEASYIISVKNPHTNTAPDYGLSPHEKAHYPPELLKQFHSKKWTPVANSKFLDFQGAEVLLIGAALEKDVTKELGECAKDIEATAQEEEEEEHEHPGCLLDPSLFRNTVIKKAKIDLIIPTEWPTSAQ